ncbi:hypothetical protein J4H92_08970 [Leucobacter weissii]|uniref:Secreted protein n=1 Tax=Leucobacter weissii TaxID=1983706 RepID=A0A939MP81_9MICO|nr:hypothetical protein [Leucobacter weissii]MBO1902076.1 hypothetical protein [Leucobacter weissii]
MDVTHAGIGRALAALATAVLLAGCASSAASDPQPSPESPAGPVSADAYLCMGAQIPRSAIENPVRIADLDETGRDAIAGATDDAGSPLELEDPEEWIVATRSDTLIILIRTLDETRDDEEEFDTRAEDDHETIELSTELWEGWAVAASNGGCVLTVQLDGLGVPYVWLDPDFPPDPESRELRLMVLDSQCGGDIDMPERIEVVQLDEGESEVGLLLGTQPLPEGGYECPGFSPTPYTLELDEPLGDRVVVDLSRVERRELV